MSTEVISLIGFFIAAVVFGYICFKGVHLIPGSIVGVVILCVTSSMPIYSTLTGTFMTSFGSFISKNYLILFFGAIFAEIMRDAGAISCIAQNILKLCYKFPAKYQQVSAVMGMTLICFIIVYGGITTYAAIFTLVALAKEVFEELDIHWGLYALGSLGSGKLAQFFPGTAELVNQLPIEYFGSKPSSGAFIGVATAVIIFVLATIYTSIVLRRYKAKGIGFHPSGSAIAEQDIKVNAPDVKLWQSLLPMVCMWVTLNILNQPAAIALAVASVVAFLIFFRGGNVKVKTSIREGSVRAITSLSLLAAVVAYGSVLAATPGYQYAISLVDKIPGGPASKVWLTTMVMCAVLNSASGGIRTVLDSLGDDFLATGISPDALHRMVVVSSLGMNSLPHNSGTATVSAVAKLNYKDFYGHMFMTQLVIPCIASFLMMLMVSAGIQF